MLFAAALAGRQPAKGEGESRLSGSRSATTFPNCNLFRNAHAGTSMGDGIACGSTASCADGSPSARSPEGDPVSIGGAAAFTKGATLKHPGWRNDNPPGSLRMQSATARKNKQ